MKYGEIIKEILKETGRTQGELAYMLGYKSASGVNELIRRPDTSTSTDKLVSICKLLGYEVVIRSTKRKSNEKRVEYVLEQSDSAAAPAAFKRKRMGQYSKERQNDGGAQ